MEGPSGSLVAEMKQNLKQATTLDIATPDTRQHHKSEGNRPIAVAIIELHLSKNKISPMVNQ